MASAVLSPHPDDAVLSCWHVLVEDATLPHAIRFGWPASVTGEPPDAAVNVDACWKAILFKSPPPPGALRYEACWRRP